MPRFKESAFVFSVALIIIITILACAGPGGVNVGGSSSGVGGVIINTFEVFPTKVPDGDTLDIMLDIQNNGPKKASGIAYIYGPAWIKSGGVIEESFDLEAADPINNIPGGKTIIEKSVDVNAGLPEGMSQTYTLYARLCYPYTTTYVATVTMTSKNEFKISRQGITQSGESISASPITIDITTLPEYANDKLVITFTISNNGRGYPTSVSSCTPTPDFSEVNRITSFTVTETSSGKTFDCSISDDGSVRLSNGRATVRCTLNFGMSGVTTPKTQLTIKAEAQYTYYVESQTSVTVYKETI